MPAPGNDAGRGCGHATVEKPHPCLLHGFAPRGLGEDEVANHLLRFDEAADLRKTIRMLEPSEIAHFDQAFENKIFGIITVLYAVY